MEDHHRLDGLISGMLDLENSSWHFTLTSNANHLKRISVPHPLLGKWGRRLKTTAAICICRLRNSSSNEGMKTSITTNTYDGLCTSWQLFGMDIISQLIRADRRILRRSYYVLVAVFFISGNYKCLGAASPRLLALWMYSDACDLRFGLTHYPVLTRFTNVMGVLSLQRRCAAATLTARLN